MATLIYSCSLVLALVAAVGVVAVVVIEVAAAVRVVAAKVVVVDGTSLGREPVAAVLRDTRMAMVVAATVGYIEWDGDS